MEVFLICRLMSYMTYSSINPLAVLTRCLTQVRSPNGARFPRRRSPPHDPRQRLTPPQLGPLSYPAVVDLLVVVVRKAAVDALVAMKELVAAAAAGVLPTRRQMATVRRRTRCRSRRMKLLHGVALLPFPKSPRLPNIPTQLHLLLPTPLITSLLLQSLHLILPRSPPLLNPLRRPGQACLDSLPLRNLPLSRKKLLCLSPPKFSSRYLPPILLRRTPNLNHKSRRRRRLSKSLLNHLLLLQKQPRSLSRRLLYRHPKTILPK